MDQTTQNPLDRYNSQQQDRGRSNRNGFRNKMQQQVMDAWRPVPTVNSSIILYSVLFMLLTSVGVIVLVLSSGTQLNQFRYDHLCTSDDCNISVTIGQPIPAPVFVYYKLTNFYQNSRMYHNSKSKVQQSGQWIGIDDARNVCGDKSTNNEMGWTKAVDGTILEPGQVAFPCGQVAHSLFNDTYDIGGVNIKQTGITIPNIQSYYRNFNLSRQGIDLHNEHFLVWHRPSIQAKFSKLWGIINEDLPAGVYTVRIKNNFVISSSEKWLQIGNSNVFGNTNNVLGIGFSAAGGVSLLILLAFVGAKGRQKIDNVPVYQ